MSRTILGAGVCVLALVASGCAPKIRAGGGDDGGAGSGAPPAGDGPALGGGGSAGSGGGPSDPVTPPGPPATARRIPTQGSAVAITADDKWAVAVNRTAGRVTVFKLDFGGASPATRTYDLDLGADSEPWAAVIGNDDDSAFVILRRDQALVRIRGLRSAPTVDATRAPTGSEPTGIAISPTGARLYCCQSAAAAAHRSLYDCADENVVHVRRAAQVRPRRRAGRVAADDRVDRRAGRKRKCRSAFRVHRQGRCAYLPRGQQLHRRRISARFARRSR